MPYFLMLFYCAPWKNDVPVIKIAVVTLYASSVMEVHCYVIHGMSFAYLEPKRLIVREKAQATAFKLFYMLFQFVKIMRSPNRAAIVTKQRVLHINVFDRVGSNQSLYKSTAPINQSSYGGCNHINIIMILFLKHSKGPRVCEKPVEGLGSITFREAHMGHVSYTCVKNWLISQSNNILIDLNVHSEPSLVSTALVVLFLSSYISWRRSWSIYDTPWERRWFD